MSDKCGCVPGYYTCGTCEAKERSEARAKLTHKELAYDNWAESRPCGCYCHIIAPCGWCTRETIASP